MNRQYHKLVQGSKEWHQFRSEHFTASEAAAMMGVSKYQSRDELLAQKATGITPDVDAATQKIFDAGHRYEEMARLLAENIVGEELFAPTMSVEVDGLKLSASMDGMNMMGSIIWEHKTMNKALAIALAVSEIPKQYLPQLEQQLLVSGADKCLFMASDGTKENVFFSWYESDAALREKLIAGWKQFKEDLVNYVPTEKAALVVAEVPITSLPALNYQLNGLTLTSNLDAYKVAAAQLVEESKIAPQTDQDFANRESQIKAFKEAEKKLKLIAELAVGEIKDVATFTKEVTGICEMIRIARIAGEKQVKARKEEIKHEIVRDAQASFDEHVANIKNTLSHGLYLPQINADFGGAIKGKRTVTSIQEAANDELARAKIKANQVADIFRINLKSFGELAKNHGMLFPDLQQIVGNESLAFDAIVKSRISEHEQAEEQKQQEVVAPKADTNTGYAAPWQPEKVQQEIMVPKELRETITLLDELEALEYFFGEEDLCGLLCDENENEYDLEIVVYRKAIKQNQAA